MAVGAARPAIHHREPARRRRQYRHRGGREGIAGRLHAPPGRVVDAVNATSTTSLISTSSATSRRSQASFACRNVMVVNPSVPAKTIPELIAYAKANPGKLNMASAGNGTSPHVAGELFKMMAGVDMLHVPYRSAAPALTDLLGGQVQVMFSSGRVDRTHQDRQAARARCNDDGTLGRAARHPDSGRFRAWLRGEQLVWRRRAQEHAGRDRRKAQQGDQCRPRRSQGQGAACQAGRHRDADDPC